MRIAAVVAVRALMMDIAMLLRVQDTGTARACNPDEVRKALAVLADPAAGVQLQAAPYWGYRTFAGNDLDGMAAWVDAQESRSPTGIYYGLNPVPATLADRMKVGDVLSRRWLLVDVDRVKTKETLDLSATETEKRAAQDMANDVALYLDGQGWPQPVIVDSGNGWHLLYRIELPNDPLGRDLVKGVLHALAGQFDGERGTIGDECHDARRISKLPGTWACKGPDTPERPHRRTRLHYAPPNLTVVGFELLQALGKPPPAAETVAPGPTPAPLPVLPPLAPGILRVANPDRTWARAALEAECRKMAMSKPGDLNPQLFRSGAAMGNLVGSGLLTADEVYERLMGAAHDAGCDNPRKDDGTLRRAIETGTTTPRKPAERNGDHAGAGAPAASKRDAAYTHPDETKPPPETATGPVLYTLPQILGMTIPEPVWTVPGILSEGLTLLAGKPKLGKSMLALNLAITVAAGGMALDAIRTTAGDVLYLSLEDRLRRVKFRAEKMLGRLGVAASGRLSIAVAWPRQGGGGLGHIKEWLQRVTQPRLIIVDVWQKFRPMLMPGSQYEQDYNHASALKAIGDSGVCSILALHHCKKAQAEDVVDEVSGTLGLAGAADGICILSRSRSNNEAELFVTGRDTQDKDMAIEFDPETFVWKYLGQAAERTDGKLRGAVIDFLKANATAVFGVNEIGDRLNINAEKRHSLRSCLSKLTDEGVITRAANGRYTWPVVEPEL